MRISQRCEYALRALVELAKRSGEGPVRIEDIARQQSIPKKFLANLLVQLRRGQFVESKKGPQGGYYLAGPARQIKLGEVVRFLDGSIAPIRCVSRSLGERCEIGDRCGLFPVWKRVRDAIADIVDGTSIADILEEQQRREAASAKALMYHI